MEKYLIFGCLVAGLVFLCKVYYDVYVAWREDSMKE